MQITTVEQCRRLLLCSTIFYLCNFVENIGDDSSFSRLSYRVNRTNRFSTCNHLCHYLKQKSFTWRYFELGVALFRRRSLEDLQVRSPPGTLCVVRLRDWAET
jgi:hypothetical protein